MIKLSTNSRKDIFIHAAIIVCSILVLFLGFFFVYLPWSTNHGETITVPNLKGMTLSEMEDALDDRNLGYEISDCTYVAGMKPLTVISQYPIFNSTVKEGRKIYITINSETPPLIKLPNLKGLSVRSAEQQLLISGLIKGDLHYVNDIRINEVVDVEQNGIKIQDGMLIPKGSKIDLVIGNGTGDEEMDVPDVVGKPLDEVKILLAELDINLGSIIYEAGSSEPAGTIVKQNCASCSNNKIRAGETLDLWVAGSPE